MQRKQQHSLHCIFVYTAFQVNESCQFCVTHHSPLTTHTYLKISYYLISIAYYLKYAIINSEKITIFTTVSYHNIFRIFINLSSWLSSS